MTIPGYDLDDLDEDLQAKLDERELSEFLTEREQEKLRAGESLLDLLDEDDLDRLLAGKERQ